MKLGQKQGEKFHEWTHRLLLETKVRDWKDHELLAMHSIIQDELYYRFDKVIHEGMKDNDLQNEQTNI